MTTRQEKNGHGTPAVFVLCKGSSRPLRGVELAILSMKKHEKCLIELKPEMGLMHDEVKHSSMGSMFASQWKDKNSALRVYIELIDWLPRATTHLSEDGFEGIKHVIKDGEGWETPRVPFHVSITCQVREVSASDGMLKQGALLSFPIPQLGAKDVHNFSLGEGVFPPVVESCISSMHSQEECVFYCPETCMSSWLERKEDADKDSIHIPRFIEFQIKLMDFLQVRDVMGDGQVTKRVIQRGTGEFPIDCPLEDTSVKVRMRVRERSSSSESLEKAWYPFYMDASMDDVIEFCTGMGEVPDCIDQSVRLMLPGEVCVVHASVEGHLDSNDNINIEHLTSKIPSGKAEIEMTLLGFEQAKYAENMSPAEKLARATSLKEQGNALYRNGKTKYARMKYNKALNLVGKAYEFGEEEMRSIDIKVSCMLNLAACAQADTSYGEAIDWCNKVIEYVNIYYLNLHNVNFWHLFWINLSVMLRYDLLTVLRVSER